MVDSGRRTGRKKPLGIFITCNFDMYSHDDKKAEFNLLL